MSKIILCVSLGLNFIFIIFLAVLVDYQRLPHPQTYTVAKKDSHKIFSYTGCGSYQNVVIEKDLGDQWFCTTKEAQAAGFISAQNCPP